MRQDMPWKWEQEQQKVLEELKDALVGDQVMSDFDPSKQNHIIVDASPVGLSWLLTQEGEVISYASRALSDVDSCYSQTESKQASARIERWKLRLMPYDCKLIYQPGKDAENPADFLSRHPCSSDSELQNLAEDYVNITYG